jgi:uncharacterized damage-inducible protein DinB
MQLNTMFTHWSQVRADLLATIDKFSDAELNFTPYPGAWPVGQVMLHIADCEDYWLHCLVQKIISPDVLYQLADYPTKAAIQRRLHEAHQRTVALLERMDESDLTREYESQRGERFPLGWIIWHVLEHEIHHRGELSMTLGLLGREGLDV